MLPFLRLLPNHYFSPSPETVFDIYTEDQLLGIISGAARVYSDVTRDMVFFHSAELQNYAKFLMLCASKDQISYMNFFLAGLEGPTEGALAGGARHGGSALNTILKEYKQSNINVQRGGATQADISSVGIFFPIANALYREISLLDPRNEVTVEDIENVAARNPSLDDIANVARLIVAQRDIRLGTARQVVARGLFEPARNNGLYGGIATGISDPSRTTQLLQLGPEYGTELAQVALRTRQGLGQALLLKEQQRGNLIEIFAALGWGDRILSIITSPEMYREEREAALENLVRETLANYAKSVASTITIDVDGTPTTISLPDIVAHIKSLNPSVAAAIEEGRKPLLSFMPLALESVFTGNAENKASFTKSGVYLNIIGALTAIGLGAALYSRIERIVRAPTDGMTNIVIFSNNGNDKIEIKSGQVPLRIRGTNQKPLIYDSRTVGLQYNYDEDPSDPRWFELWKSRQDKSPKMLADHYKAVRERKLTIASKQSGRQQDQASKEALALSHMAYAVEEHGVTPDSIAIVTGELLLTESDVQEIIDNQREEVNARREPKQSAQPNPTYRPSVSGTPRPSVSATRSATPSLAPSATPSATPKANKSRPAILVYGADAGEIRAVDANSVCTAGNQKYNPRTLECETLPVGNYVNPATGEVVQYPIPNTLMFGFVPLPESSCTNLGGLMKRVTASSAMAMAPAAAASVFAPTLIPYAAAGVGITAATTAGMDLATCAPVYRDIAMEYAPSALTIGGLTIFASLALWQLMRGASKYSRIYPRLKMARESAAIIESQVKTSIDAHIKNQIFNLIKSAFRGDEVANTVAMTMIITEISRNPPKKLSGPIKELITLFAQWTTFGQMSNEQRSAEINPRARGLFAGTPKPVPASFSEFIEFKKPGGGEKIFGILAMVVLEHATRTVEKQIVEQRIETVKSQAARTVARLANDPDPEASAFRGSKQRLIQIATSESNIEGITQELVLGGLARNALVVSFIKSFLQLRLDSVNHERAARENATAMKELIRAFGTSVFTATRETTNVVTRALIRSTEPTPAGGVIPLPVVAVNAVNNGAVPPVQTRQPLNEVNNGAAPRAQPGQPLNAVNNGAVPPAQLTPNVIASTNEASGGYRKPNRKTYRRRVKRSRNTRKRR